MISSRRMPDFIHPVLAGLAVLGATSAPVQASAPSGSTWYTSPSGDYSLNVKLQDQYGVKGATYYLEKDGVWRWLDHRMYALRDVVVTDKGLVVGFAYRRGARKEEEKGKIGPVGGPVNPPQYLHVVILAANGNEILNDVTERVHPPFRSTPGPPLTPHVAQLLVDSANDRVIVRLVAPVNRWQTYRLSTGESLGRVEPGKRAGNTKGLGVVVDLRPVAGTPLLLVHRCITGQDYKAKGLSGRFTLLDTEFHPLWSFDAVNDYAAPDFGRFGVNHNSIRKYFRRHPAIRISNAPGRFAIRLFAENKEVSFAVKRADGVEYEVAELGRTNIAIPEKDPTDHLKTGE